MTFEVSIIPPAQVEHHLLALADLRIQVFAAYPYLYDGDRDYEARYLQPYVASERAVVVGAWDGERLVGASTGTPMEDHDEAFQEALEARGVDPAEVFYCAESVLLAGYRGRGAGHRFFDLREDHARALGRRVSVFCSVRRPRAHPRRPADYRPLDGFWRRRGYEPWPGAVARFSWKEHGEPEETEKQLQVWGRNLTAASEQV